MNQAEVLAIEIRQHIGQGLTALAPMLICGVVSNERERSSLDLLLTTQLGDAEILWGKLASRLG